MLRFRFNVEVFIFVSLRRVSIGVADFWDGLGSMRAGATPFSHRLHGRSPLFPSSVSKFRDNGCWSDLPQIVQRSQPKFAA